MILQVTIAASGCVRSVEVLDGPDPGIDVAVLRAASLGQYKPASYDGVPIPWTGTMNDSAMSETRIIGLPQGMPP